MELARFEVFPQAEVAVIVFFVEVVSCEIGNDKRVCMVGRGCQVVILYSATGNEEVGTSIA